MGRFMYIRLVPSLRIHLATTAGESLVRSVALCPDVLCLTASLLMQNFLRRQNGFGFTW